jgi:glutamate-1-semialdehyde 2,1-aminomutase
VYERTFALGQRARSALQEIVNRLGIRAWAAGFGSVVVLYFKEPGARHYTDLLACDTAADVAFRRGLLERGSLVLPMAFKRLHISAAHTERDIDLLCDHAEDALKSVMVSQGY